MSVHSYNEETAQQLKQEIVSVYYPAMAKLAEHFVRLLASDSD